jgi:hypothetical protein
LLRENLFTSRCYRRGSSLDFKELASRAVKKFYSTPKVAASAAQALRPPVAAFQTAVLAFIRPFVPGSSEPPAIASSTIDYHGPSKIATCEIFPAERVEPLPHPFERSDAASTAAEPAHLFELSNIDFWGRYGGSVVTADDKLLADLSPEVWGVENHPIFSQLRLPKPQRLAARTAIAVTPEAPGNYYHWVIDLLPRLALIKSPTGSFDSFAQIVVNGSRAYYDNSDRRRERRIDILKVDVEGWELNVLAGLEKTIMSSKKITIFCEYNPSAQECAGRTPRELLDWFLDRRFALSYPRNGELHALPPAMIDQFAGELGAKDYTTIFAQRPKAGRLQRANLEPACPQAAK